MLNPQYTPVGYIQQTVGGFIRTGVRKRSVDARNDLTTESDYVAIDSRDRYAAHSILGVRIPSDGVAVRLRLTPTETVYYSLFATAANNLVTGAKLLTELLGADVTDRREIADRMRAAEHAADENTHAIYKQLSKSFITPFDREDIYRLAGHLDDVMDCMDAAVDLVVLYSLQDLPVALADQVEVLERMAELTAEAMPRLRSMKNPHEYWIEINRLENQGDKIYRKLLAHLFSGEYEALTVLKLKEVVDQLEAAADAFEHAANSVEQIVLKES